MMRTLLASVIALALAAPAMAQTVGAKVPPYQAPPKVQPRDAAPAETVAVPAADPFAARPDLESRFASAYAQGGKPRLAFYWNRQLSDTLGRWVADKRVVVTGKTSSQASGDWSDSRERQGRKTMETQRRESGDDNARPARPEIWEWEFQDGFLGPFLSANAHVADRTAITRIMGAGAEEVSPQTVEVMALQNMADLMVEVLVADSGQSSSGYELRARILDVKTGRILAMVNSRSLKEWRPGNKVTASPHGFELSDEDEDTVGPERADKRYKATASGYQLNRKPPRLDYVARNLAYNVMNAMLPRLEGGAPPAAAAPAPITPPPAPVAPNDSALPRPKVEAQTLPAPSSVPTVDEPPMPKPSNQ
jgi:hypothetical protein